MSIQNVKVKLDGIDLQIDTNGIQPLKVSMMEAGQPWLGRDKLASLRADDDTVGFDVTMLSGKRVRVNYGSPSPVVVPQNNNQAMAQLYRRYKVTGFDLSGTGMSISDMLTFYTKYSSVQQLWLTRAKLIAQLGDADISVTTRDTLLTALADTETAIDATAMPLVMYGNTYSVLFAEGQSCLLTTWVIAEYADFKFSLISRQEI